MKSVPSLVASSTVAAAATGLTFGRQQQSSVPRPDSNKRKAGEYENGRPRAATMQILPSTSAASNTRPLETHVDPAQLVYLDSGRVPPVTDLPLTAEVTQSRVSNMTIRRRRGSGSIQESGSEDPRDSLSSRGSWYKRLSTLQLSNGSGSPRSSVGPDSPLMNLSHGSGAPILNSPSDVPAQLRPNKLVKRACSERNVSGDSSRSTSRSKAPTLRRPATSHQRSATIQQHFRDIEAIGGPARPPYTADGAQAQETCLSIAGRTHYRHYFEARTTKTTRERSTESSTSHTSASLSSTSRRVTIPQQTIAPTLMKAEMILKPVDCNTIYFDSDEARSMLLTTPDAAAETTTHKRPKRSLSLSLSSSNRWLTRNSSLRSSGRLGTARTSGKRYFSAPLPSLSRPVSTAEEITYGNNKENSYSSGTSVRSGTNHRASLSSSRQNSSSPLPVLSRSSGMSFDAARLGFTPSSGRQTPSSPPISQLPRKSPSEANDSTLNGRKSKTVVIHQGGTRRIVSETSDQASTLVGSDSEVKSINADDDDEIPNESIFDSFRTTRTGSSRVRSPALESMFDDSPVSASGRFKGPAANLEFVGNGYGQTVSDRIMEEDEGVVTPPRASIEDDFTTPTQRRLNASEIHSSPPNFSLAKAGFRGPLADDEEDEDWTKDDEDSDAFSNSLSPPSTYNSRRVDPAIRAQLASLSEDSSKNVFDWSESLDRMDTEEPLRPKTAHAKQMLDGRGGRAVGRMGYSAVHVRSQSVPIVPQNEDAITATKKFGTWGLGGKIVSEDWDDDFVFDGANIQESSSLEGSTMLVPASIRASQAIVTGHVSQIREVISLTERLKELRARAKELALLTGKSAPLWRQADGIIALAATDVERLSSPPMSPASQPSQPDDLALGIAELHLEADDDGKMTVHSPPNQSNRPARFANDELTPRRRSVLLPGDDIFGITESIESDIDEPELPMLSRSSTKSKDTIEVARSVMEQIHQHRVVSNTLPINDQDGIPNKMPFDTVSLRDLVNRAKALVKDLSAVISSYDISTQGSNRSPDRRRDERESSPAFLRVFTPENLATPASLPRSHSGGSVIDGNIESSPTRHIPQRMQMMTAV